MRREYGNFKRVIITGEIDERNKALEYIFKNGYKATFFDPINISSDTLRFKIVGEKQIRNKKRRPIILIDP